VPRDRLAAALADCERIARPAGNSHVDLLGDHYSRLRQCMPRFLEVLTFCSHRHDDELLEGIDVLKKLNRTRRRNMPPDAPLTFVPRAWMPFVLSGEDKVSRRFWELALLWRLRDGLRSGDVWVEGSRRYADPETYLLTGSAWADLRDDYCRAVERPRAGRDRIAQLGRELNEEAASFASMLGRGEGPARLEGDRLVVGRDTSDDQPESVKRVKGLLAEVFPLVELTEVLIAIDGATGFSGRLLQPREPTAGPRPCWSISTPPSWPRPPTSGRWRWPARRVCRTTRWPTPRPGTCVTRRSPPPSTTS
jgi:hypothetical protein